MTDVRVLSPDDWRIWRELRLAALAEAPQAFGSRLADWQGEGDTEERWRARLSIAGSHNIIALIDGNPVGMASGVPGGEPSVAELISMWVSPAARGRGVGGRLVAAVEQWARQAGAGVVKLCVYEDNAAARALYQRAGFTGTGELLHDGDRREVVMFKGL